MRVLITTDVVGGVWVYTAELIDALERRGHECALVAFGGEPSPGQTAWVRARPDLDFTNLPYPLEWMPDPEPGLSRSVDAFRREVERFRPDVAHLNQFVYGAVDLGVPKLLVAHSDVVTWWRAVKGGEPPGDAWFGRYRGRVRDGLEGADVCVAPSGAYAASVGATYGIEDVRVVHNGRSAERFGEWADAERRPRVVSAGRLWDEAKGARDLIPAARDLADTAEFVVAGVAKHPAGGDDFPTDASGIRYAGVLAAERIGALYASARVYAATSRYEPFGLAPLEAALAGCALVAADIPTFRELWDDCAIFYPPGDVAALTEALRVALEDDTRRRGIATRAADRARAQFSPERMARDYEALYRELGAGGGAAAEALAAEGGGREARSP